MGEIYYLVELSTLPTHTTGAAIVNELSAKRALVRRTAKSPPVDDRRR